MRFYGTLPCAYFILSSTIQLPPCIYYYLVEQGKKYHQDQLIIFDKYQYTDKELKAVNRKIVESGARKAIINFHTVRSYKDAARLKVFRKTGNFPRVTGSFGINSLLEVLAEDTKFPTNKLKLIRDQGWKIFDWKDNQRRRVSEVIKKLPDQNYHNLHDLIQVIMTFSSKLTSFQL